MTNLNFKISELIHSDEAVKHNINNMPDINSLDNMLELIVYCLQPLREKLGKPMVISSGYRNTQVNKLVNGATNSGHTLGCAVDFTVSEMSVKDLFNYVKNSGIKYYQLINEKNSWVHIDYRGNNLKGENLYYDGKTYTAA